MFLTKFAEKVTTHIYVQ